MRIVFVGAVDFSLHCLREVLRHGGQVVGVVTLDRDDASFNSDYSDLTGIASEHGIPVLKVRSTKTPDTARRIADLQPDVIFVFGWSQLLPRELVELPPLGCIGTHPALLPRNRGRHPLIWALVEGLEESGLTFFFIDEGADSGDILWQQPFRITLEDDAATLYEKMKALASRAIPRILTELESGAPTRRSQDHSRATYWRKRGMDDGEIQWEGDSLTAHNLIRALTRPYVGAHTFRGDQMVKVWKSRLVECGVPGDLLPGSVWRRDASGLHVRTGDGTLVLVDWFASVEIVEGDWLGRQQCESS
jgi:methionyl-tRNA formyltransferase